MAAIIPDDIRGAGVGSRKDSGGAAVWRQEFGRYLVVSVFALIVDTSLLVTMSLVTHYLVAASCGFVAGAVVSYWLATRWAFQRRKLAARSRTEFGIYLVLGLLGLGLNNLVIFMAFGQFGLALVLAKAIAAMFTFTFNFLARKLVLF